MYGINSQVGTEPFPSNGIESNIVSGFATIKQKEGLTPLKVLFGNKDNSIPEGATVFVKSEDFKAHWAMRVHKMEETKFILVPETQILVVKIETETPETISDTHHPSSLNSSHSCTGKVNCYFCTHKVNYRK